MDQLRPHAGPLEDPDRLAGDLVLRRGPRLLGVLGEEDGIVGPGLAAKLQAEGLALGLEGVADIRADGDGQLLALAHC